MVGWGAVNPQGEEEENFRPRLALWTTGGLDEEHGKAPAQPLSQDPTHPAAASDVDGGDGLRQFGLGGLVGGPGPLPLDARVVAEPKGPGGALQLAGTGGLGARHRHHSRTGHLDCSCQYPNHR